MKAQNQISNVSAMLLFLVLCFVSSCKTEPDITGDPLKLPVITTATSVTDITAETAICGGNISDDKGHTVTARGVCWSTNIDPTIRDSITKDGSGIGTFQSSMNNLKPNTSYYVRAYATNSSGTAYGSALNFTTDIDYPNIITFPVSLIKTTSATCGGNIDNDGGSPVTARGICWSATNQTPTTILTTKTIDGTGTGIFTSILTGLTNGTTYYVRAYATNSKGTIYGNMVTFSTSADLPTVSTGTVSSITTVSANIAGSITYDGGGTINNKGICWSTNAIPTISDNITNNGTGNTSFVGNLTNLTPGTLYYARAYATNSIGTGYGNTVSFTSVALKAPTVTTTSINNILAFSATGGGTITNDGGSSVTSKGICWSTSHNPTIELTTKIGNSSTSSSFASNITDLVQGTTYYVRAYATNAIGTNYGNEVSFTTKNGVITLSTSTVSSISAFSGVAGGSITADGGTPVTARGICYSTNPSPTINNSKVTNGSGTGSFTSNISGLNQSTTYYVRAYATNAVGTSYGNEVSFTTQNGIITLSTKAVSSILAFSGVSGGNVTADGGTPVTARGICYSTSSSPTINNSTVLNNGSGIGSFTSNISGLNQSTTYYVRAYATNAVGTSYGNEVSFTTQNGVILIESSQIKSMFESTASSGAIIISDGGAPVIERGVCWSTSQNPNVSLSTKTFDGVGIGAFTSNITGLVNGTTYYLRAYARNVLGIVYGDEISFISTIRNIGDTYMGGLIFYFDNTGQHGLVCAPTDQSSWVSWGSSNSFKGATFTAIGTGRLNTDLMIANTSLSAAANVCVNLTLNTYSDWYLPSIDELGLMISVLKNVTFSTYFPYWSSSEIDKQHAWSYSVSSGRYNSWKDASNNYYVRAIRSF